MLLAVTDTGCGMDDGDPSPHLRAVLHDQGDRARAPGWAWRRFTASSSRAAAASRSTARLGRGTTFKIYLPSIKAAAPSGKPLPDPSLIPRGTETILLAEDEPQVRAAVRLVLETCGYTVLATQSVEEALQICRQHPAPIHLLITDVVLPKKSGRQLAEAVVAMHPHIKVLYISGYTDDAVVRHGVLEAGMHFLQKPFTPMVLAPKGP